MSINPEPTIGRHYPINVNPGGPDQTARIYVEEVGAGTPLVCLHTAGADARQYRHLMADNAVTSRFRVIAFDLPWHGRSTPPGSWWREEYRLTTDRYAQIIRAVL